MSASNRVALVTGANRGIGLETSRQLAEKGVTVLMGGRDPAAIKAAAEGLRADGLDVLPIVLDVTDHASFTALRDTIAGDFGRLDILVNNAGIITGETFGENSTLTIGADALRSTFEVNVYGPIALTQVLLPLIEKAPAGRIVNLSSILGSLTIHADLEGEMADLKPLAYDASKAALNQFTTHLAAALRHTPIKVNSAHPGWVKTGLGGDAAPMQVIDGARTSVELALLDADGPTGRFIHLGEPLPW